MGRVLASDVSSIDLPLFDNSSVDGFAVIAADLSAATRARPRTLRVVADIPAGSNTQAAIRRGQAARIMTGAPLPGAADAVIMVEDTDIGWRKPSAVAPAEVRAMRVVRTGENVRGRGMDVRRGRKVLLAGHRLRAQDLGMLAMLGLSKVSVFRRPRVALLSSGDELIPLGGRLQPGKVRDTNSYTLNALINAAGCDVLPLGIARDSHHAISTLLERAVAMKADLILASAGVSVGPLDLIREVVKSHGQLDFWRVNVRPGKPLAVGTYRRLPFIGLPGNPVSAYVGFEVFVRPALASLCGLKAGPRKTVRATLTEKVESDGRESYLRSVVRERQGTMYVRLTGHQGSGNLLSLVEANALLIVPAGVKSLAVGDRADVWLL
jgi:molybdopterin molybdotransferase